MPSHLDQNTEQAPALTALDAMVPRPRPSRRLNPLLLLWLLVPAVLVGVNWQRLAPREHTPAVAGPVAPAQAVPAPQLPAAASSAQPVEEVARSAPRPLADCLAGGTAIDEQVLRCRFGQVPRPSPDAPATQGMVSAAYLAQFHARQPTRGGSGGTGPEWHQVDSWDGHTSYRASWQVSGNQIEGASVCGNLRPGSIDYRECRKGAKQWFKQECQRASREGSDDAARQRYCSAASSFSPMG